MTTVVCNNSEPCNCLCNCHAYLGSGRKITVNPLEITGNQYAFSYTITDPDPSLSFIIFCIQCPTSKITLSSTNTTIQVIGNPSGTPVNFTQCTPPGCESSSTNRFSVEFDFAEEEQCCPMQGIKVNVNPAATITEIKFNLIFTLPTTLSFSFQPGVIKTKSGQIFDVVNNICMPGCCDECDICTTVCETWSVERKLLDNKKDSFIHFGNLLLPDDIYLSSLTLDEIEKKLRLICKTEKSVAELNCSIARVLASLNSIHKCDCDEC